jgi:hypothetical protein
LGEEQRTFQRQIRHRSPEASDCPLRIAQDRGVEYARIFPLQQADIGNFARNNDVSAWDLAEYDTFHSVLLVKDFIDGRKASNNDNGGQSEFLDLSTPFYDLFFHDWRFLRAVDVQTSVNISDIAADDTCQSSWKFAERWHFSQEAFRQTNDGHTPQSPRILLDDSVDEVRGSDRHR